MEYGRILFISLLILIWWIGCWGVVETIVHLYVRGSTLKALSIYSFMIFLVIFIVYFNPTLMDHFI